MERMVPGLLAGLYLLSGAGLGAQDLTQVYRMTPRAGNGAAVQAALRSHTAWRAEQGDPWSWSVFEEVQGPNLGDWIVVSGGHSWEDLDAYDRGFGTTYYRTYYDVLMGPSQPRKRSVRWYRSWGDVADAPTPGTSVAAEFGEEEATSVFDAFRESVESTQDYVLRLHPEMAVPGM